MKAGRRVDLLTPQRGDKRNLIDHALDNAADALGRRLAETSSQRRLLAGVAETFGLDGPPNRIEVYDNSHISGTHAIGAMIVAGPEGFVKKAYRKFTIRERPGDDTAMMGEVLTRRFRRALDDDPGRDRGMWPDLVLIDGGVGQLNAARTVMTELGIDDVPTVAVAKGPDRDAGRERFFLPDGTEVTLAHDDPLRYFPQRLRD